LNTDNWKIYYLNSENSILSTAFCYETDKGCYLYNSTRNNLFNDLNPGIILNDLIIQKLINEKKKFFDFLKGTERYKYDFGGTSVQLYDLEISL
jgi:CelD/BcsL family acetyltransferase involved in cellulose biosynthesis